MVYPQRSDRQGARQDRSLRPLLVVLTCCLMFVLFQIISPTAIAAQQDVTMATEAVKVDPEKRVCKRVKSTSTRISQKVCMKQRKWDELTEQSQRTAERMRDTSEIRPQTGAQ